MRINSITNYTEFQQIVSGDNNDITNLFVSDLMSHVMGNAEQGNLLITVLNNINVIGVVSLLELSGVVFTHNIKISEDIIAKAKELHITIYRTALTTKEATVLLNEICI